MPRNPETPQDRANKLIISKTLNTLLLAAHTTQAKVSEATHIPRSTLTGYFKGTTTPNKTKLAKLSAFFKVSQDRIDPRYAKPGSASAAVVDLADDQAVLTFHGQPLSRREVLLIRQVLLQARRT